MPMFRSKAFSVRRRFSDFLGLYEKLSVKQSLQGCIIPPPPEKSVVGECPSLLFCVCFAPFFVCLFCASLVIQVIWINRNDKSEGGNGWPIISWVCGEKKSSSGEVRIYMCFICSLQDSLKDFLPVPEFLFACSLWQFLDTSCSSCCHHFSADIFREWWATRCYYKILTSVSSWREKMCVL